MRDAFTRIKKSSDKRECVALRSLPRQNYWRKSQSTSSGNPDQCWFCKGVLLVLGMFCCFFGSMRCKSGSANKFKIHVSCVFPPSDLRISLQFKLHQERIKICNPQPKNVLWEIILGVLEMPCAPQKSKWAAARTIHPTCPEAGNELKNI